MSYNQNLVDEDRSSGKKKGSRFMRHREKYSSEIDGFNLQDKSQIKNGLVRERACTDMFCAIALVVCAIGFFGVAGYALTTGKIERIFSGVDGDHNVCGQHNTKTANYPLLLVVPYPTKKVVTVN